MICPVCVANAALAVAGAATSGGAAAMALRIFQRKHGVKRKVELRLDSPPRQASNTQSGGARFEWHR